MAQQIKVLAAKSEPGTAQRKERTDFCKLFSDVHMDVMACVYILLILLINKQMNKQTTKLPGHPALSSKNKSVILKTPA